MTEILKETELDAEPPVIESGNGGIYVRQVQAANEARQKIIEAQESQSSPQNE
jgi:hypothetical protein